MLGGTALGLGLGGQPAGAEQHRLGPPDLLGETAVALRLARLFSQSLELDLDRGDDIVEPLEIFLGSVEFQFGLAAARMKPGGAGGFFEQEPPFGRFRVDQRGYAPLAHHRAGMSAARGIGEQQLDVARPHLAPVDAVDRAAAAFDPPHDLDFRAIVERKRCVAAAVVQGQRDFGDVAGRSCRRPGEDHIVHLAAAQASGRGFPHHPAQRLDQVRLAAAVRSDHAGQAGLDQEVCRLNERLESE